MTTETTRLKGRDLKKRVQGLLREKDFCSVRDQILEFPAKQVTHAQNWGLSRPHVSPRHVQSAALDWVRMAIIRVGSEPSWTQHGPGYGQLATDQTEQDE